MAKICGGDQRTRGILLRYYITNWFYVLFKVSFMRRLVAGLFPLPLSIAAFLVMYNNLNWGRCILIATILLNLLVLMVPTRGRRTGAYISAAKPASLGLVSAMACLLVIEAGFPYLMPAEFAQVIDLTKSARLNDNPPLEAGMIVYNNDDQVLFDDTRKPSGGLPPSMSWHSPGTAFMYYGHEPNANTRYANRFAWNSQGYFDHDYTVEKPDATKRVVIVGDSYVEAVQVPLNRTFHKLVESELNGKSRGVGGPTIQVIALGNSGTGQAENFRTLRDKGLEYRPDVVVMTLCSNDFCDDDPELKKELILASGEIGPTMRGLARHGLYASAFALRRFEDVRRNRIAVSPELLQWSVVEDSRVEAAWSRTLDYIGASRELCRQKGIMFMLVYLGSELEVTYFLDPVGTINRLQARGVSHKQIEWDITKSAVRVAAYCEQNGVPLVSMLDPFIKAQNDTGNHVFGDHYSMFGHEIAARVIGCALEVVALGQQTPVCREFKTVIGESHSAVMDKDVAVPHGFLK